MNNSSSIDKSALESINRIKCKESELEKLFSPYYNNTMNHKMKDKDTENKINPTSGLWPNSVVFTTTNKKMVATSLFDPYLNQTHNIRRNPYKTFEEELQKFKNMGKKQKLEEKKEEKGK